MPTAPAQDWVVLATTRWDGSWLVEHNLAHALAAEGRVLYVEPPVSPLSPLRGTSVRVLLRRGLRDAGRLQVTTPLALPPLEDPRAQAVSAALVRAQLRQAVRRAGLRAPAVLCATARPGLADARIGPQVGLVSDWLPAGAGLLGVPAERLLAGIDEICRRADVVAASSAALARTLAGRGFDARVLPHGFSEDLAPAYAAARMPPALAALPAPRIGYGGTIDGRLSVEGIAAVARAHPEGSVILLGPVSPRAPRELIAALEALPNVHLPGPVGRDELPSWLVSFDCLLMPYVEGEWSEHGSPLKLWEYLYAGPPIAASGYTELREHAPPLLRWASPPERLDDAVRLALAHDTDAGAARRAVAADGTWRRRASDLRNYVAGEGA